MSSFTPLEAGPSNSSTPPPIKKRRIPNAGVIIMEAFLKENGAYPSREDRNELLKKIWLVPGGETYDEKNLRDWFKRRRRPTNSPMQHTSDKNASHASNSSNSPYPTLTAKAIKHLTTLASTNPYPQPILIQTWAELLSASQEDVVNWLSERRSPVHHLPTPVSTSPEPASEYQWDLSALKADPINTPVIPSCTVPSFCSPHAQRSFMFSDQQLIAAIMEASQMDPNPAELPSSSETFLEMFEAYQDRMNDIIRENEKYLRR